MKKRKNPNVWLAVSFFLLLMVSTAAGGTIYVDDDGPADFNNIQAGINDSIDGDIIIVNPGTYTGYGNRDIDFLGKAITVRSTDPNDLNIVATTIIDCNGTETEPHRGFYFHTGEDANSILAGITIINGYAPSSWPANRSRGGAIYCYTSNPTLTNCIFSNNSAGYGGGVSNEYCNPILTNCIFSGNSADYFGGGMGNNNYCNPTLINCIFNSNSAGTYGGGMDNNDSSYPTLTNCTFNNNSANYGGGISNDESNLILINCVFNGNFSNSRGGGMSNSDSSPTLINCIFNGNFSNSGGGGMFNDESNPILTNCTFSNNSAKCGGGMNNDEDSNPILTNCTFSKNSASYAGGIYNSEGSFLSLTNCIFWNNGNGIQNHESTTVINYSNVQGGWPGFGNIDADPCFVEPGYWDANGVWVEGDYHLLPDSPCIDAGDPNYVAEPNETDLDGKPRVIGGRIDMGAYEYSPPIPAEVRIVPRTINLTSKGKWITCHIWLSEDYNVADIDPNSVLLEDEIEAESVLVDEQEQVAMAKFSRSEVQGIFAPGEVELTVSGELIDGTRFEGTDILRVIDKSKKK